MKKANIWFFCFSLLALAPALNAQVNARLEEELLEALEGTSGLDVNLTRVILEEASSNTVQIEQHNRQLADVQQTGNFNEVYIYMDGDRNGTAVRQAGNNNYADISLDGADSTIGVFQDGNGNSIHLDYRNTEDVNARFIQNGSNIQVTHQAEDIKGLDYTIEFTGFDMNIQVQDLNPYLNR